MYSIQDWANDLKLHIFATKQEVNIYSEQLTFCQYKVDSHWNLWCHMKPKNRIVIKYGKYEYGF
jgi:hypothetical protein